MSIQQATEIDRVLREQAGDGYLGALRVLAADELHWTMYGRLPNRYRVVGDELRVLHTQFDVAADDARDHVQLLRSMVRPVEDAEMRRLLLGLTTLAFDLLTLIPPPGAHPLGTYERNIADMSRRLLNRTQDAGEQD